MLHEHFEQRLQVLGFGARQERCSGPRSDGSESRQEGNCQTGEQAEGKDGVEEIVQGAAVVSVSAQGRYHDPAERSAEQNDLEDARDGER